MARRIALSGVRLAVKRPAMRRPCQRRRMRRVGPGVAGILRYKVSGKTPAIAAVGERGGLAGGWVCERGGIWGLGGGREMRRMMWARGRSLGISEKRRRAAERKKGRMMPWWMSWGESMGIG